MKTYEGKTGAGHVRGSQISEIGFLQNLIEMLSAGRNYKLPEQNFEPSLNWNRLLTLKTSKSVKYQIPNPFPTPRSCVAIII